MTFIEPLNLEVWLIQIFAGTPEIFAAIALLVITSMASMFRMTLVGLFLMIAMFLLIFIAIIGGLVLGYWFYRIFIQ